MRRILVTGANKGIGLAIVRGVLRDHDDTFVFVGSRDAERGRAAVESIVRARPELGERLALLEIDVSDDASVARAAEAVGTQTLYGVVNNAGVGDHGRSLAEVLDVNVRGIHRVCETFLSRLDPERGRIVNVTSASGPMFVSTCSPELKRIFVDPHTDWEALERLMAERLRDPSAEDAYGFSKACANAYTRNLALRHPKLRINACTPGFIETDMTRRYAEESGQSPAELGMKTPDEGARAPLFLLFGDDVGRGHYYGSDAKRSPLDRYRSPGSPEYTSD